mgnify:CR=1 FL=1
MPFDRTTGKPLQNFEGEDYSVLTGELLLNKMKKNKSVVFVTAAVGFPKENREKAGNQSLVPTQLLSRERTTSFHRMYVSIKVRLLQF